MSEDCHDSNNFKKHFPNYTICADCQTIYDRDLADLCPNCNKKLLTLSLDDIAWLKAQWISWEGDTRDEHVHDTHEAT